MQKNKINTCFKCAVRFGRSLSTTFFIFALALSGCSKQPETQQTSTLTTNQPNQPNILLIVADDLGYTDLSYFGSEIATPNIDNLAQNGLVLTNYYSAPLCAPTRAELLSGTDYHKAGQGLMGVNIEGHQGYDGRLNEHVLSAAERFSAAGYSTFMTGKWHLGKGDGHRPADRGFSRSFIMTDGGSSHYADSIHGLYGGDTLAYFSDGEAVSELPADFYTTDAYTDYMLQYIEENTASQKPFFGYLAYTAPHWPIQAPQDQMDTERGNYDQGYGVLRQQRFEAWKSKGFGPADLQLPRLPNNYVEWENLSSDEQAKSKRTMETFAAMVKHLDRSIGRLLKTLDEKGILDNTIVIFQSDNGAEAGSYGIFAANADNSLDNIGHPGSFAFIGPGWAEAGSAPFRQNKTYTTEGGIRVPAMVYAPKLGVKHSHDDAVIVGYDMLPTFLDLAGIDYSPANDPAGILPITGRSFADLLSGNDYQRRGENDVVGREHAGHGAIRKGDWKLVWENDISFYTGRAPKAGEPPAGMGDPIDIKRINSGLPAGEPIGTGGPWKLFNIKLDPSERNDLSAEQPEVFAMMMTEWNNFVKENNVIVRSGTTEE